MKYQFRRAVLLLVIFVVLASIHLFFNAQNISIKYRITDLKVKLNAQRSENRIMESMASRRENLSHIEKLAKDKLGMVYPGKMNYILITKELSP